MGIQRRIGIMAMALTLLGVVCAPGQSWGQTDNRIATVLAVDGTAEVRAANATTWEPLQFRAALFEKDTVRTAADSKVKVLLRDDSIMTLAENGEMEFTVFLLNPEQQQRNTIVNLVKGKLRVITAKIFGADSVTQVRTANTVAGVRGTTFVVIFIPPEETDVVVLDGEVGVRNPNLPQSEQLVSANFRTQVIGDTAPRQATAVPPGDRQALELGLRLTEQIPAEVKTSGERLAAGPIRGEPTGGTTGPAGPPVPSVAQLPAGLQPVQQNAEAQLNQLFARTQAVSAAHSPEPSAGGSFAGGSLIQPDVSPPAITAIQSGNTQPSKLNITITIPR